MRQQRCLSGCNITKGKLLLLLGTTCVLFRLFPAASPTPSGQSLTLSDRRLLQQQQLGPDAPWKDAWLKAWIAENAPADGSPAQIPTCSPGASSCTIPKYLPPRTSQQTLPAQRIPRVIWQTWKGTEVGPVQFQAMVSHIEHNPEYEYIFFDDSDVERFLCEVAGPEAAKVHATLVPGAAKADVWRLTVILRYGGVYLDSDSKARVPLREFVLPESAVVSGFNTHAHLDQWALLYAPGHPFIARALARLIRDVDEVSQDGSVKPVVALTGPWSFNVAVQEVMRENGCLFDRGTTAGVISVSAGMTCPNEDTPNAIGRLQIIEGDDIGGNTEEVTKDVFRERQRGGYKYYKALQGDDATLFRKPANVCAGFTLEA